MKETPIFYMTLGERRAPRCAVRCEGADVPELRNAKWELSTRAGVIASGDCEHTQKEGAAELTAIIQPEAKGEYLLTFWYDLGREHLATEARINVS